MKYPILEVWSLNHHLDPPSPRLLPVCSSPTASCPPATPTSRTCSRQTLQRGASLWKRCIWTWSTCSTTQGKISTGYHKIRWSGEWALRLLLPRTLDIVDEGHMCMLGTCVKSRGAVRRERFILYIQSRLGTQNRTSGGRPNTRRRVG